MIEKLKDLLRMGEWAATSILLLAIIALVAPQQLPVVTYKVALVATFAHMGYWIHRKLFRKFGREDDAWSAGNDGFGPLVLSRAIVVAAVILAGALAL
jgi:hypothetical protein